LFVPVAGCQVVPPSVETSTPATTPPPESVAVPEIVTGVPSAKLAPGAGLVIVDAGAVEREMVGLDDVVGCRVAVVGEHLRRIGRRRHVDQPGRPEPVVDVFVPLIAQRPGARRECQRLARLQTRRPGVAPEPQGRVLRGHLHVEGARVRDEVLTGQRVLRLITVGGRTETRITPGTSPSSARIDQRVRVRVLVRHQRAVRRVRAVDRWLPTRLPEDFVA
jgi:hypothetical protein